MKKKLIRAFIEIGFVIALFYINLFMGEFDKGGPGYTHSLVWAVEDVFTLTNIVIAVIGAFFAYVVFEYLRKQV
jgi:hypothetical protein